MRVTSGTRLERLISRGTGLATARSVRVIGQLLLVVGLVFVLFRLRSLWRDAHISLNQVSWLPLIAAFAIAALAVVATAWIWLLVVRRLGGRPERRWVGIFLEAQLGKYIPGSVWHYAGRAALVGVEGLPLRVTTFSVSIELGASILAALVVGALTVSVWAALAAAAVIFLVMVVLWQLPLPRLIRRHSAAGSSSFVGTVGIAAALYVPVTIGLGAAFWLMAGALVPTKASLLAFYAGAFAIAWVIGLVAVFAPVGLGVREAILVALLRQKVGTADAVMVAVAFRALLTIVDVGAATAGALVLRGGRSSARPAPSTVVRRDTADQS